MARWPDNWRSTALAFALIFVLLPFLFWLCWWIVRG